MKTNKFMRIASILLVAVILTTCAISGTFAKYTTETTSEDQARVATWGFGTATMDITGLFDKAYDNENVLGANADVIAPGTANSADFSFVYAGAEAAPEVAYSFEVSTAGSTIADDIKTNTNIQWKLDNGAWSTWDAMIADIEALDGDKDYAPGEFPTAFNATNQKHTISWQWLFDANEEGATDLDAKDTAMGDKANLDEVKVVITINATQID